MTSTFNRTVRAYKENDPPVEIDQRWIAVNCNRTGINRRVRILAPYPGGRQGKRAWIYEEMPGGQMKMDTGRLGICPEFNLRYVFELEK